MNGCDQLAAAIQAIIDSEGSVTMGQIFHLGQTGFGCGISTVEELAGGGIAVNTADGQIVIEDEQIDRSAQPSAFSQPFAFGLTLGEALMVGLGAFALRRSM
ncbi:MAG: hypothetical protein K0U52_10480 [Gammaproteobacteria bacterium]|nr:hypothetical protein [Gammaproteobacteria bacterium]